MDQPPVEVAEDGLATPEALEDWLSRKAITLWDAALIANGALPGTDASTISKQRRDTVFATQELLSRSVGLEPAKTAADQELYKIETVFKALAEADHEFPDSIRAALQARALIPKPRGAWQLPHGNTLANEDKRQQVIHAMIRVLADPKLHPSCRKDGAEDGEVLGTDLARTIIANEHR